MLVYARSKRNVVILAPATKGMKKKNWVLVSLLDELFTSVLEQKNVAIVKWVAHLECINSISAASFDLFTDFFGSVSVLVHAVVEDDTFGEVHAGARNVPVALGLDDFSLGVVVAEASELTSADFLLSVFEENGVVDDSKNIVGDGAALEGNFLVSSKSCLLLISD